MDPTVTFVLALVGVVLSASSLTWNVVNFLLSGSWVNVQLAVEVDHHEGEGVSKRRLTLGRGRWPYDKVPLPGDYEVGFVVVIVRNRGRIPVTVDAIAVRTSHRKSFTYSSTTVTYPHRLEAQSSMEERLEITGVHQQVRNAKKRRFRGLVRLATGTARFSRPSYKLPKLSKPPKITRGPQP